jgi:non-specific serine/threonine protein kinase
VTLTGAGGTGKSRLAIELAGEMSEEFGDGVYWVELATLNDPTLVPRTVASALHLRERVGWSAGDVVIDHLRDKTLLLALDNCEHLLAECSRFAAALLAATGDVRILATSREPLRIGGEHVYPLPPLAVPPPGGATSPETICQVESVQLFEDRAQAADPDFRVTPENATAVSELCRRVDGLPLAVELAAARVHVLPPAEIVARLDSRLSVLASRDRTVLPRHRTMSALIDWSCDLLSAQERTVLQRLSIFNGGWTLEAAEAVCSDETVSKWEFLGLFTRLVEQSLVERDQSTEGRLLVARYRFLEPVRQHVLEELREGGQHAELRRRHRAYFLSLAEMAETELRGPKQAHWLDRLAIEHDNFRAALELLPEDPEDVRSRLRLAAALARFWFLRGFITEGARRCDQTVSDPAGRQHTELWARVWAWKVWLLAWHGDLPEARAAAEQACAVCRSQGHQRLLVFALNALASVEEHSGNLERAESVYEEARALSLRLGDDHALLLPTTANLAELMWRRGNYRRAFALARDAHLGMGAAAAPFDRAENLRNLARPAAKLGKRRAARRWLEESLRISRAIDDRWGVASSLELLAVLDAELGRPKRATRLLAAADVLRSQVETPISPADLAEIRKYIEDVKRMLGREAFEEAWSQGRAMPLTEVIEHARQRNGRHGGRRLEGTPCPS